MSTPTKHGAEQLRDYAGEEQLLDPDAKEALNQRTLTAIRKGALLSALDSALDLIVQTRALVRDSSMQWTSGERLNLAVVLEQIGRTCFSVARECEQPKGGEK